MNKEEFIKEYPQYFDDELDKWLYREFDILGGAQSSIESMKYHVAREVAEKAMEYARQQPVSDDLEEEASIYQASHPYSKPYKSFKEGAKWVIRQMPKVQREEYYKNGFQKGKRAMKRQLMKDAYEGYVSYIKENNEAVVYLKDTGISMPSYFPKRNLEDCDTVKVLVVKDE